MLRPNYSTVEHVTALIKMFRPSLVTTLLNICIIILPMLRPNCSTVGHVTALIKMLRPSLVTRDTRFT